MTTKVVVLTGYLGAGKTTTLNNILKTVPEGKKVGVIVNEFAVIGVDGRMVEKDGVEVKQLSNGCVCCSKKQELRENISFLIKEYQPEIILVETSGVASIEPFSELVEEAGAELSAVVTVVDAKRFEHSSGFGPVALKQIQHSSLIAVNKKDLVSKHMMDYAVSHIKRLNPVAKMMETKNGVLSFKDIASELPSVSMPAPEKSKKEILLSSLFPAWFGDSSSKHLAKSGFGSVSYRTGGRLDRAKFDEFVNSLPRSMSRAKGFANFHDDDKTYRFQYASGLVTVEPNEKKEVTQLVLIGRLSLLEKFIYCKKLSSLSRTASRRDLLQSMVSAIQ